MTPFQKGFIDGLTLGPVIRWIGRLCVDYNSHLIPTRTKENEMVVRALLKEADERPFTSVGHWVEHGPVADILQYVKWKE